MPNLKRAPDRSNSPHRCSTQWKCDASPQSSMPQKTVRFASSPDSDDDDGQASVSTTTTDTLVDASDGQIRWMETVWAPSSHESVVDITLDDDEERWIEDGSVEEVASRNAVPLQPHVVSSVDLASYTSMSSMPEFSRRKPELPGLNKLASSKSTPDLWSSTRAMSEVVPVSSESGSEQDQEVLDPRKSKSTEIPPLLQRQLPEFSNRGIEQPARVVPPPASPKGAFEKAQYEKYLKRGFSPSVARICARRAAQDNSKLATHGDRFISPPETSHLSVSRAATTADGASVQLQAEQYAAEAAAPRQLKRKLPQATEPLSCVDEMDVDKTDESTVGPWSWGPMQASEDVIDLIASIRVFAERFPAVDKSSNVLESLLVKENEQLVRYIGCLAMGDKTGEASWEKMLSDTVSRHAVVVGIVGRALVEEVFGHLAFGADPGLEKKLSDQEEELSAQDGFLRTSERAKEIKKSKLDVSGQRDKHLDTAVAKVTAQLGRMLLPFWLQSTTKENWKSSQMLVGLSDIVKQAAVLNRRMRADGDTVYHWQPTFKDEQWEPDSMEAYNLADIIRRSPYKKTRVNGQEYSELKEGQEDRSEAIVMIVCFPALVAYQQGGGDLARRELREEDEVRARRIKRRPGMPPPTVGRGGRRLTGNEGFRTRMLSKSVVMLEWGTQRLLTREAGTGPHLLAVEKGDKKYEKDYQGFVELFDLFLDRTRGGSKEDAASSWMQSMFLRSPRPC